MRPFIMLSYSARITSYRSRLSGMSTVTITGLGHFHPPEVIPNEFFNELDIGSDADWVTDRVGIRSRCSVLSRAQLLRMRRGEATLQQLRDEGGILSIAEMSKNAWQLLETRLGRRPEVDMVLCGTSVPDFDIPANACTIAAEIGYEVASFDVNSACSSFIVNLHTARAFITAGQAKSVAIFNPERYSMRMNYEDRASCVLFGDGCASANIVGGEASGFRVIDTVVESLPSKHDLIRMPVEKTFYQNGSAVQKFAITRTLEITRGILDRNQMSTDDVRYFVGHQANLRMVTSAASKMGFKDDQHLFNVDQFGNQGAAGAPAVLSMNWDRFKKGDIVAVAVVGSGLTWGAALLEYQ